MSTTQENVLRELRTLAEAGDCELVVDHEWANTGTVYVRGMHSLDAVGETLRFEFDGGRHISFKDDQGNHVYSWDRSWEPSATLAPHCCTSLDDLVAKVDRLLTTEPT